MGSNFSGSARNHANALQKVRQAPTASCQTEPSKFFHLDHYLDRTMPLKAPQYRWKKESWKKRGVVSQTDVKGSLQIKLQSPSRTETVLAWCDFACNHSWISETLVAKLLLQGTATKLKVDGINSQETVDTQMVQLRLLLVHSGDTKCSMFDVKPFARKQFSVGNDFINVDGLKQRCLHLEPILLKGYSYPNIEMILGQDMFHVIRPLEYFENDWTGTAIAVLFPLDWVLGGPLP